MIELRVSRSKLEEARARLRDKGIDLRGDRGEVSANGCTVRYEYEGDALRLEVLRKPFLVSTDHVESKIREWFADSSSAEAGAA